MGNAEKNDDPSSELHLRKQRRLRGAEVIKLPIFLVSGDAGH